MTRKRMAPIHPGEVLLTEFLEPLGLSQYRLAKDLKVPARRINEIVHGDRAVSADTALRLARFFGTSDRFWLNLQAAYDLPATVWVHDWSATFPSTKPRVSLGECPTRSTIGRRGAK